MLQALSKSESGVYHNTIRRDFGSNTTVDRCIKPILHFDHHVFVARGFLHTARNTLHMHDTNSAVRICHHIKRRLLSHPGNIIDHRSTSGQRFSHNRGFVGINRDRHSPAHKLSQHRASRACCGRSRRWNAPVFRFRKTFNAWPTAHPTVMHFAIRANKALAAGQPPRLDRVIGADQRRGRLVDLERMLQRNCGIRDDEYDNQCSQHVRAFSKSGQKRRRQ